MRVITKSILREMGAVAGLTLLGLIILVLLQQTMRLGDLVMQQGVSLLAIAPIVALALPALVVTILPVCALMAPAITYSRLAADSELLALRATGYSFTQLLSPMLGFGILIAGMTALLIVEVIPQANFLARKQIFEAVSTSLQLRVRERVFQSPLPGIVLYVEHIDKQNGRLQGVLLADSRAPEAMTIFASEAEIVPDFPGMRVVIRLHEGTLQRRQDDQNFQQAAFEQYSFVIEVGNPWDEAELSKKRVREMSLREIRREAQDLKERGGNFRRALVEWHKRLALPVACFVLAFVGAPLGGLTRRTGRLGGFALSAAALLVYYLLVTTGASLAELGTTSPAFGVWFPNLLAALTALALIAHSEGRRPLFLVKWLSVKLRWPSRGVSTSSQNREENPGRSVI
ncbi:MAG TPA: LptF/LptG family permease [Alphaproteobacteria bacterium]|nr:LptF/LptG family permease [Alphaproteobacteria bacterium]